MRKGILALLMCLAVAGLAISQNEPQSPQPAPKIMGLDTAPQGTPDSDQLDPLNSTNPAGNGLGIYWGVVLGNFNSSDAAQEIACDFGSSGVWVFDSSVWHQITGVNPEFMIGSTLGDTADDEIIGDFGTLGLWMWHYNSYPGTWTQISGLNAEWAFAADDDGDTHQEIFVDFGATGLWHWDNDGPLWTQYSGLNPIHGFRMDSYASGWEEGCILFPTGGVFRFYSYGGSSFTYQQLTGTVNTEDDHASAKFTGGAAEDMIMDFGAGLGIWLLPQDSLTAWHQISTAGAERLKPVRFGSGNPGVVIEFNSVPGLTYWTYSGYPGTQVKIHDTYTFNSGFWEPFDYTIDAGTNDDELAVDFGTSGLWKYEYNDNSWAQLSGSDPLFMVAGDYFGDGRNTTLMVAFATGLYLYDGLFHSWSQLSGVAPDSGFY